MGNYILDFACELTYNWLRIETKETNMTKAEARRTETYKRTASRIEEKRELETHYPSVHPDGEKYRFIGAVLLACEMQYCPTCGRDEAFPICPACGSNVAEIEADFLERNRQLLSDRDPHKAFRRNGR